MNGNTREQDKEKNQGWPEKIVRRNEKRENNNNNKNESKNKNKVTEKSTDGNETKRSWLVELGYGKAIRRAPRADQSRLRNLQKENEGASSNVSNIKTGGGHTILSYQ